MRGTAVGMMLGVGRLDGILGLCVTGRLLQFHTGSSGLFAAIGKAVLLGACGVLFARPGRSMRVQDTQTAIAQ